MLSTYLLPRFEGSPVLGFGGHICREPRFGCNPVSGFGGHTYREPRLECNAFSGFGGNIHREPGFGATWSLTIIGERVYSVSVGSRGLFTEGRGLRATPPLRLTLLREPPPNKIEMG